MKTVWKDIPVFISSTFNDMHAERDYLVKFVFPELADWCARRKLRLNDIDLRWGITAEDSRTKRTLGICLRDIDESRPFFLGFLGQRRGWQPSGTDIDEKTFHEYPELSKRIENRSVTEMEIEHALLEPLIRLVKDKPSRMIPAKHAFIFLREDHFTDQLNDAQKRIYTNRAEAKEGEDPANSPSVQAADEDLRLFRKKLEEKADFLRHYQSDWNPNLPSPELGGMDEEEGRGRLTNFRVGETPLKEVVIDCLKKAILEEYPERAQEIDESSEEEARLFFEERMAEGYIEQPKALQTLEQYLKGPDRNIMVLYAPSGRGKTTLLCAFAGKLRKKSGWRVLLRSCGSGPDTSSVLGVFDSIFRQLGITPPLELGELKTKIESYLDIMAREKTALFLDALDQIPGGEDVLRFLPGLLPENLKIICSIRQNIMTGDLTPANLLSRGITACEVLPFASVEDKKALVNGYLETHLKKLGEEEQALLFEKKGSSNPLYLKAALSELKITGRNSILADLIGSFGDEPEDVFNVILARMEEDMGAEEKGGSDMVSWLFSLLACSRYGLEQDMLCDAMYRLMPDTDRESIRSAVRTCQRQERDFLMQFGLLTDLRYYAFRNAARRRYPQLLQRAHSELAAGFLANLGQEYQEGSARDYTEAVYHLLSAKEERAGTLLRDIRFMRGLLEHCGIGPLIECYDLAKDAKYLGEERLAGLTGIGRALKNSGYILQLRPWELEGQLSLRLDSDANRQFLQDMKEKTKHTWLRVVHKEEAANRFHVIEKSGETVIGIARFRDGLVIAGRQGSVRLLSLPDGNVIRTIRKSGEPITCACVIGNHIYLGDDQGLLYNYNLDTGALMEKRAVFKSAVTALAAGPAAGGAAGAALYAADLQGNAAKIDTASLSILASCRFISGVSALCCDAQNVYVGCRNGKVTKCEPDTLKKLHTFKTYMGIITALYSNGKELYAGGFAESVALFFLETGEYRASTSEDNDAHITQIFPLGDAIGCFSGKTATLEMFDGTKKKTSSGLAQSICLICRSGAQTAGETLYFATAEGLIGYASEDAFRMEDADSAVPAERIVNGNRTVLVLSENHRIRLYDKETSELIVSRQMKSERIASACFCRDHYFLGRMEGQIMKMDESGFIEDLIKYKESLNISSDIPVRQIACEGNQIVYYRYGDLNHVEIEPRSLRWTDGKVHKLGKPSDCSSILVHDFKAYCACGKKVIIYDLVHDKKEAELEIPSRAGKMLMMGRLLLIACEHGAILSYAPNMGKFLIDSFRGNLTDFDIMDNRSCVASMDGPVFLYQSTLRQASLTLDDKPYAVCMDDACIYAGTYGGAYLQMQMENKDNGKLAAVSEIDASGKKTVRLVPDGEIKVGDDASQDAFPGGRGAYDEAMDVGEAQKTAAELPGIRPLKFQNLWLALHGLLYFIAIGCVLRGDVIAGAGSIKALFSGWSTWLASAVLLGMFFVLRYVVARDENEYRNNARILPASLMLTASCVVFMLVCSKCMAAGNPARISVAKIFFYVGIFAQYLYLVAAYVIGMSKIKLIGLLDMFLEWYVNGAAAAALLIMLVVLIVI